MPYSTESDVYDATGYNSDIVQKLSQKTPEQVTTLINGYIAQADLRIKRLLGVPISIRKEYHLFESNHTVELGPYEDPMGFFSAYDPLNCVDDVYAIYQNGYRVKLPYPKDCDSLSEDIINMNAGANCTLSRETSIFKCGTASIKAIFTAAGSFDFPKNHNLEKNIEPWNYVSFWFRTNNKTATFTIELYDKDGNKISRTFTVTINDTWQIITLQISKFTDYSTTRFNEERLLQYITIKADKACTIHFDNFNFNDGFFWTYPEGLICWSTEDTEPYGEIEVTYAYDPYKVSTPEDIKEASARLAGVRLVEFLIGCRQRVTGFQQMSDDLEDTPDRDALEMTRSRLRKEAEEILSGTGFKTYSGLGSA